MDPRYDWPEIRIVPLEEKIANDMIFLAMHSIDRTWINLVVVLWWCKNSIMCGFGCLYYC